jgi:glycerol kinase
MNTGAEAVKSDNGLLTTIAATADGRTEYALEGSVFVAGAGIQWLRDELEIIPDAASSEVMASSVPDTNGVYIVPAFTGLGAPYWDPYARGTITGITRGCKRAHIVRAMLEALGYQSNDLLALMERESGVPMKTLKVDGGASRNDFLMQFQADISAKTVIRPACVETTAMGAAFLAGLATGFWQDEKELLSLLEDGKVFYPGMSPEKREKLLEGWEKAVRQTLQH